MNGVNRNWLFVKVVTDQDVYGWGEGTLELHEHAVEAAVKAMVPRIIGRDPTQIEKLWQAMYRHGFWRGGPVIGSAISAIDQALWDITGKVYGQPVYKLLGGAVRERVRVYTHASDLRGAVRRSMKDSPPSRPAGGRSARAPSLRRTARKLSTKRSAQCARRSGPKSTS